MVWPRVTALNRHLDAELRALSTTSASVLFRRPYVQYALVLRHGMTRLDSHHSSMAALVPDRPSAPWPARTYYASSILE